MPKVQSKFQQGGTQTSLETIPRETINRVHDIDFKQRDDWLWID